MKSICRPAGIAHGFVCCASLLPSLALAVGLQIVVTRGKDEVLSEKSQSVHFGRTCVTTFSKVSHTNSNAGIAGTAPRPALRHSRSMRRARKPPTPTHAPAHPPATAAGAQVGRLPQL